MFSPEDCIPVSALQHYLYCPRRCALIHLEQIWTESAYTAEGRLLHDKAHSDGVETRGDVKTVTGLALRSLELGLSGQADVVEFHRREGKWRPYPVEYKRGRAKSVDADRVQLCAQALCLEEMLKEPVPEGALFYGKIRRRVLVPLTEDLRALTRNTVDAVHALLRGNLTPPPPSSEAVADICPACSLLEDCMPESLSRSASRYLESLRKGDR